jgi:hypothetical protein
MIRELIGNVLVVVLHELPQVEEEAVVATRQEGGGHTLLAGSACATNSVDVVND